MRRLAVLALTSLSLAAIGAGSGAMAADPLRIGAMPIGSGWYVAASTLEKTLRPVIGNRAIEVIPRGGGVANPVVVDTGKAEIALSNVQTSRLAARGEDPYKGKKAENIRGLVGGLNAVYLGAMVRNDFIKRTGLDTFDRIMSSGKALRIVMKPQGSNVPPAVDTVLAAYGLSRAKIKANGGDIIQVNPAQVPAIMRDGRADILLDTVLKGHPMITELSLTADVSFLDLSQKALDELSKTGIKPASIPQWFKGQTGATKSGDFGTVLIAHQSLPEDVAYKITKTVIEKMPEMAKNYPAWASFKAEDAARPENVGIALHSGATRYYKERGWLK